MARPITFNLVTVDGLVQSFDSDYLAEGDLPRPAGLTAGGYDGAYIVVDQYGRVTAASVSSRIAFKDAANTFSTGPQTIDVTAVATTTAALDVTALQNHSHPVSWSGPSSTGYVVGVPRKVGAVFYMQTTMAAAGTGGTPLVTLTLDSKTQTGTLDGGLAVLNQLDAAVALSVSASASQSANLVEVYDAAAALVFSVDAAGAFGPVVSAGSLTLVNSSTSGTTEPWLDVESQASATGLVARFKRTGESSLSMLFLGGTSTYLVASGKISLCEQGSTATGLFQTGATAGRLVFLTGGGTGEPDGMPGSAVGIGRDLPLYGLTWSTTTEGRVRWHIDGATVDNTDASRKYRCTISAWDTAAREGLRVEASGSAAMLGVLGASAVVRQTSGADLTNNVTSGGTSDTIANYTDLIIYANDAAAIRNDLYQIARKLKQVNDALRLFGFLT